MSKSKTKINTKCAENIKTLLKIRGIKQYELAEMFDPPRDPREISRYLTCKYAVPNWIIEKIHALFPNVRIEFIMGLTDYMTLEDEVAAKINANRDNIERAWSEAQHEANLLNTGLKAFAELAGYEIRLAQIRGGGKSLSDIFSEIKTGTQISKGSCTITLSMDEMNRFENEVYDFVELKLKHLFKQKGFNAEEEK